MGGVGNSKSGDLLSPLFWGGPGVKGIGDFWGFPLLWYPQACLFSRVCSTEHPTRKDWNEGPPFIAIRSELNALGKSGLHKESLPCQRDESCKSNHKRFHDWNLLVCMEGTRGLPGGERITVARLVCFWLVVLPSNMHQAPQTTCCGIDCS